MTESTPRRRGAVFLTLGVIITLALVALGIVPRMRAQSRLVQQTHDAGVLAVAVFKPKQGAPVQEIVLPGTMQAFIDAPIFARTSGYIKRWSADLGVRVHKGQLLAEIESPEIDQQLAQARADLATATANSELSQITSRRYQELRKTDSVSQQDLDNALGDAKAKAAMAQSASANVSRLTQLQSFERVEAPFDGVVTARNTDVGQLIDAGNANGAGHELFHLAAVDTLRVFINVPQIYASAAQPGVTAYLTLAEAPGRRFAGRLSRNARSIDLASRTLLAEVDVDNRKGELLPGGYAQVHIDLPQATRALLVPASALIFQSQGLHVATVDGGGHAHLTPVTPGRDFGQEIEIVAGIGPDSLIIDNPPDSLAEGQRVRAVRRGSRPATRGTGAMEPQSQREQFRIADLTVDVDAVSVVRDDGRSIELTRLSFDLLVALARRAPAVVGTEELIATVWAGIAISDETLTQRVALLRRALGDEARHPRYLRAVRGRGYQLLPAVEPVGAGTSLPRRPVSRLFAWSAGVTALALAAGLVAILAGRFRPPPRGDTLALVTPPSAIVTRSASVSELLERAGGYLSRHQEANNELAIELYQRALTLEPNNAEALAGLSLALGQRATKFNRHGTTERRALELARRAVALDPQLGRAHHALGLALDSRGSVNAAIAAYLRAGRLEERPAAALASAANLMQVEGRLAEALETDVRAARLGAPDPPLYVEIQIGSTLALLGFEPAATVWFERALELRPDNLFAAAAFARARWSEGRFAEADAIAARGLARGVRRAELPDLRGNVALRQGDRPLAKSLYAAALAVSPADLEARTRLLVLDLERPGDRAARLEDDRQELLADIRQSRAAGDEWPESAIDETVLETAAGNRDAAFRGLDVAIGLGYRDLGALNVDPLLAPLRSDPRFGARVERIHGLIDAERQRVLGAPWLPPALLAGTAARM